MIEVNGLPLPQKLVEMINDGTWKHPGDEIISRLIPFFDIPVDFLRDPDMMQKALPNTLIEDSSAANLFFFSRDLKSPETADLPYLNPDLAIFIAINREIGGDIAIALDYRTNLSDPRVVANDWQTGVTGSVWREVNPSFSAFVRAWKK